MITAPSYHTEDPSVNEPDVNQDMSVAPHHLTLPINRNSHLG